MKPFSIGCTLLKPSNPRQGLSLHNQSNAFMHKSFKYGQKHTACLHALQNKDYRVVKTVTNFTVMSPVCNLTTRTRTDTMPKFSLHSSVNFIFLIDLITTLLNLWGYLPGPFKNTSTLDPQRYSRGGKARVLSIQQFILINFQTD